MPFNGAGSFTRIYSWLQDKQNAEKIQAARMDAEIDGIATGLSTALLKDGTQTVTADIPWNDKKITVLGDATAATDAVNRRTADRRAKMFQCRLVYVSSTQLRLDPFNGNQLFIDGENRTIPSAGTTLANTGLVAATLYRIYAYMSGGVLTLEASATGHAADTTYGHRIKSGDATRTLVGIIVTGSGGPGVFVDTSVNRWVQTYYNRKPRQIAGSAATGSTLSTTYVETSATSRVNFVVFADDLVDISHLGTSYNSSANAATQSAVAFDTTPTGGVTITQTSSLSTPGAVSARGAGNLSEGSHTASTYGLVASGTGTWTTSLAGYC